jgi:hypothetical protein
MGPGLRRDLGGGTKCATAKIYLSSQIVARS